MWLFKKKNIDSEKVKSTIQKKQSFKKLLMFLFGALISALSFNLFFVPHNFVSGGLGGVSVILNRLLNVPTTLVILIGNLILVIASIFVFGFKDSLKNSIGAFVYILFVYVTESIPELINFSFDNILLYVLAAGVVSGFGESLVFKAGYSTGGTSILALIIQKFKKLPMGELLRYISIVIILIGGFTFGYTAIMYSLIITVISTNLLDRFLIGISNSKTFFIQTTKEEEVKDFIIKIIESGVTEFDSKGAFSNKKKNMLMCVVPTEKYSLLKSAIQEIDPEAFIVVSDCYEVLGGTKSKKLSFEEV